MKKIAMTLAALAMVAAGFAQDGKKCDGQCEGCEGKAPSVEQMTKDMVSQLGLDDKQAAKLEALNKEYADVLMAPGPRGPRGHHGRPGGRRDSGQQLQEAPQADSQQAPQAELQLAPRLQGQQERQPRGDVKRQRPDAQKMEQMRTKREEYQQKLEQILTDEQKEKLQQMPRRPEGRHHHRQ